MVSLNVASRHIIALEMFEIVLIIIALAQESDLSSSRNV